MARLQLEKLLEVFRRGAAVAFVLYLVFFGIIAGYLALIKGYDLQTLFTREGVAQGTITAIIIWTLVFFGTYILKEFFKYISKKEDIYIEGTEATLRILVGVLMIAFLAFLILTINTIDFANIMDILLTAPAVLGFLVMLKESFEVYKAIR